MIRRYQKGITSVEFAIIGVVVMTVLFGVLEIARAFFVFNTLDEVTRRAARLAAVCPIGDAEIANKSVFNTSGGTASPIVTGLDAANVQITYWDSSGTQVADPVADFSEIEYVRASIVNYQHEFVVPLLYQIFDVPAFETTVPRESLGVTPDGIQSC